MDKLTSLNKNKAIVTFPNDKAVNALQIKVQSGP
jgi:hypothetical protein